MQLLPSLLPSRMTRSLRRAPFVLALMLPIIAFIIVGRTVEIERDRFPRSISGISDHSNAGQVVARALNVTKKLGLGLSGTSSAGAGFSESRLSRSCCSAYAFQQRSLSSSRLTCVPSRPTLNLLALNGRHSPYPPSRPLSSSCSSPFQRRWSRTT